LSAAILAALHDFFFSAFNVAFFRFSYLEEATPNCSHRRINHS
jgi:hypothetical protein